MCIFNFINAYSLVNGVERVKFDQEVTTEKGRSLYQRQHAETKLNEETPKVCFALRFFTQLLVKVATLQVRLRKII